MQTALAPLGCASDLDPETGALPRGGIAANCAAHAFHQAPGDCEPEAWSGSDQQEMATVYRPDHLGSFRARPGYLVLRHGLVLSLTCCSHFETLQEALADLDLVR